MKKLESDSIEETSPLAGAPRRSSGPFTRAVCGLEHLTQTAPLQEAQQPHQLFLGILELEGRLDMNL